MTKEGVLSFKGEMMVEGRVNDGGRHDDIRKSEKQK
jgi:hypothetical protein